LVTSSARPAISLNETLWNNRATMMAYSALMLAARITLAHFSVSSAINLLKSAGEPGSAVFAEG
jgi:hypothetical protein